MADTSSRAEHTCILGLHHSPPPGLLLSRGTVASGHRKPWGRKFPPAVTHPSAKQKHLQHPSTGERRSHCSTFPSSEKDPATVALSPREPRATLQRDRRKLCGSSGITVLIRNAQGAGGQESGQLALRPWTATREGALRVPRGAGHICVSAGGGATGVITLQEIPSF